MTSLLILYGLFVTCFGMISANHHRHDQLTKILSSLGVERENDDSAQIVFTTYPRRIDSSGKFVSYLTMDLPLSGNGEDIVKKRRRRSAAESLTSRQEDHEVFIEMDQVFEMSKARLHLKKNYKLVSKNYQIEVRGRGGKLVSRHNEIDDCHYTGKIHNYHGFSKVALSLCEGVQGIVSKDNVEYFIEPLYNHTFASNELESNYNSTTSSPFTEEESNREEMSEGHPHVVYKRSILENLRERKSDKDDLGHCGYSDDVKGETPWWRVKPRAQLEVQKEKNDDEQELVTFASTRRNKFYQSGRNKSRRHHHHKEPNRKYNDFDESPNKEELDDQRHNRIKRSISLERNVETLIVADKMMVGYHGRKDVESYILTVMNIVANLYHDASIGNAVNIIVTRIILLTEDQPDLEINHHADRSLESFCRWQNSINVNDSDTESESGIAHHDNAVLLTGYDICTYQNKPCGTLGLAPVSGMCEYGRSCNINEDIGLASAFTIAHEMGHNFGMEHDGNGNDCGNNNEPAEIMASQYTRNSRPFTWSRCSKSYITKFLDTGSGECLKDGPPRRDFDFPAELPGQLHNADEQCRFQYGPQSRQCNYGQACQVLWCRGRNGHCVTNSIPAAEGTDCQDPSRNIDRGWCYQGKCVPFGQRPNSVDGNWGSWSSWSDCSRTCGGGASSSFRHCDNPAPENGGKYCIGQRRRYHTCNPQACNGTTMTFREEQCAKFDAELFRGKYYNWRPFVGGHNVNPCSLNCLAQGYSFYTERAQAVVDGTRCFANSMDMCINGECHHVGCDGELHSEAVEDKCRVCGGNGNTCETVKGEFKSAGMQGIYEDIVRIPKGAVHILIRETVASMQNYLALRNTNGKNYINGGYTIDWSQNFDVASTTFTYTRDEVEPEVLRALGPTTEDLVVSLLLQEPNKGIEYQYNVPIEPASSGDDEIHFSWSLGEWSECSATCAGGMKKRLVVCQRVIDGTLVQQNYCDPSTMPTEESSNCNLEPCDPEWHIGEWQSCSVTCGGGEKVREVSCQRKLSLSEDEVVSNKYCGSEIPSSRQRCNLDVCPPQWVAREWSQCSSKCGVGHKKREAICMSSDGTERYHSSRCNIRHKPPTNARCNAGNCPPPRWATGPWSKCSANCGVGRQRRRVLCMTHERRRSSECSATSRPSTVRQCRKECATETPELGGVCLDDPKFGHCGLVRKFKFCKRGYFRKMCCQSCSE